MNENAKLHCGQPPSYGATNGGLSSPGKPTFGTPQIQASEGHNPLKSTTVPGTLPKLATSARHNGNGQISSTPTNGNHQPGPTNPHGSSGVVHQATETTPRGEMVTPTPQRHTPQDNNGNRRTILQALHICRQYCRHCTYAVFVGIIIVIVVVSLSVSAARHPSSSTQVFAGDIVHISSLKRFLYDRAEIRQQPPEGAEQAEATIYVENCASKEQHNETNFSSRPLPYTAPQGLFNLQQQYLLAGSVLAINLTAHKPFHSDGSAKVCQFSNADDYEELLDADTKEEVIEAEKNGFCQTIEPPSGTSPHTTVVRFNIHSHGYYYYALAVVPGELTNVSYMYTLSKHYYDKKELTPYNCSVVDQNCVIDGLIIITPADCVLTLIPAPAAIEPSIPYTFYSEQSCAWGIVIVILCVTLLVYCVLIFIALCCVCYERKRTRHARGVV